jgi:RNA polymerase sigma-70 factor (family 1)
MLRNPTENELELLDAVAKGDRKAFARLFYLFHQELGEFVFKLTKSRSLSEEIVQDAFMKIWTRREDLAQVRSFRAYLFTITRNHTFNTLRDETKRYFLSGDLPLDLILPAEEVTEGYVEKEALYGIVEQAVAKLPPQQQRVWKMNKEEGLSYLRIAEKLALSPQTVKRHISLAMASVLKYVKLHGDKYLFWIFLAMCL